MANKPLQSIKFPDLPDTYIIPVVDSTLAVSGAAADAKQTGDSLADKVDKVSGKGLSTEDYTTGEKTKLANVETEATKTIIDNTLTQTGQAADAKAVGDAIASEDKKSLAAFATDTASGAVANFPDGADSIPMKDVLVHIEPVQAGSGDPSLDNIRPITGWTGCVISHSGADMTNPTTYSITFPSEAGIVYGGQLNVTTGELVVDRAMVNLGTWNWIMYSVSQGNLFRTPSIVNAVLQYDGLNIICSNYPTVKASQRQDKTMSIGSNNSVDIIDSNYSDASAFKTAMNGVQLVYELASPITYTLTQQEITSLLGTNNLWADTGDTEVEYRADAKLYITKKITEAVSALS